MQLCVKNVQNRVSEKGFKFSSSKTVCMHFCKQNGNFSELTILLDKPPVQVIKEAKFLGLFFHCKLTFKKHIQHLTKKNFMP